MKTPEQLGPYRIEGVLGKGGMGRVYRAKHLETGEAVAIKSLSPQLAMNDGFVERFRAEIESLRMLRHASIVRLFGYGQEGDTLFYAMELVDGPSLEDELRLGRRFNWREVTDIAVQVCRALKHAHDHGIIHRDIKPANILLAPSGKVKLADFGISRLFGEHHLTVAGGVIGTADYMAPEQVAGDGVTPQCDQYCLGGVIYALLAGRPPFVAKSLPEMLQLQRYAEPEPLHRFAAHTPRQLEEVVMQMLSKEPGRRFPNTLVLAKHLEAMRIALSRPSAPGGGAADADNHNKPAPSPAESGPNGITRGYDSPTEMISAGNSESIVVVDNDDDDQTPAASAMLTGREAHAAPTLAAGDEAGKPALAPRSLFTEVSAETTTDASSWFSLATQAAAGVAVLAFVGWFAYGLLAPHNADTLYNAIKQTTEPGDAAALRSAEDDVAAFLERFPDDPRASEVQGLRQAIDTERLERQLSTKLLANRLRLRGGTNHGAPPLEQLYLAAIERSKISPARAAEDLRALEVLIDSGAVKEGGAGEGLATLVRRQIERLEKSVEEDQASHRPFLEALLQRAREIAAEKPDEARRICEAATALYGDRPWAAELLDEAREMVRLSGR